MFLAIFIELKYAPKEFLPSLIPLCKKYDLKTRIKRWIPTDYRKWNYKIAELLLNKEYIDSIKTGKSNNTFKWAGLNLNNLNDSIINFHIKGELRRIKNFTPDVIDFVESYLEKHKESIKTGIDRFV